jgi:hypothetical protein
LKPSRTAEGYHRRLSRELSDAVWLQKAFSGSFDYAPFSDGMPADFTRSAQDDKLFISMLKNDIIEADNEPVWSGTATG